MKYLFFALTFFATIAFTQNASAQESLSIVQGSAAGYHNDTVIANSNVTFDVTIEYNGNSSFFGDVAIKIAVQDTLGVLTEISTDSFSIPQINWLNNGDTATFTLTHNIDMAKYAVGGNTTVIWPVAPGYDSVSSTGTVWVLDANGIIENTNHLDEIDVSFYPNPATDYIILDIPSQAELVEVDIIDLTGKTIVRHTNIQRIPLENLPNGVYFIRMQFESGQIQTYKIIKSNR